MDYEYYVNQYKGQAIPEGLWPALCARATEQLERYKRDFRVTGDTEQEAKAICAMAEVMKVFAEARCGKGGLRYASVGSVSVSGKGVYGQIDISYEQERRELYQCARQYLRVERGCGVC